MKQDDYGNKDGIGKKNSDEMAQDIKWRWRLNRTFCYKSNLDFVFPINKQITPLKAPEPDGNCNTLE